MKSFIIALLLLGLTIPSYSQDKMKKDQEEGVVKMEEKFIAYDIGKDYEGYENYLLLMETKDGSLSATYDENGKLIRVVEEYKNVRLPNEVIYSIYKTYPDCTIVNDKYLYTQEEGDVLKKQYNLKIKKDKQTLILTARPNGDILKVR